MVSKHCHDCPQFDPRVDTRWENDKPVHYVSCCNGDICREIHRYLKQMEERKVEEGFDGCGVANTSGDR